MTLPVRRRDTAMQPVRRWDPLQELEGLQEQLVQLVRRNVSDRAGMPFVPPVDIEETEDAWVIEAELPGVKPEDVTVEVRGSELSISGEIKEREREGLLRRRTRTTGAFDYDITLPGDADAENIDARLADGVLTVRIPKPARARPRRIDVTVG